VTDGLAQPRQGWTGAKRPDREHHLWGLNTSQGDTGTHPDPPVPPRACTVGYPAQDVPPPLPARKFRRHFACNDDANLPRLLYGSLPRGTGEDLRPRLDPGAKGPMASSTTQTSPKLYRATLSVDSGVLVGSPSPPTDSGLGISPPAQVRRQDRQGEGVLTRGSGASHPHGQSEEEESSDETASLCSSALGVDSDTSGSHYDNVVETPDPWDAKVGIVNALSASPPVSCRSRDEHDGDGDDEDDEEEDGDTDSDALNLNSSSDDEPLAQGKRLTLPCGPPGLCKKDKTKQERPPSTASGRYSDMLPFIPPLFKLRPHFSQPLLVLLRSLARANVFRQEPCCAFPYQAKPCRGQTPRCVLVFHSFRRAPFLSLYFS